jgi:methionyl-tRNA synthetase
MFQSPGSREREPKPDTPNLTIEYYFRNDAEISIALALNLAYLLSLVIQPFMPTTSNEIREQLNMKETVYALENAFRCYLPTGHTIGQARPLFKRIEKPLADEYRLRFSGHSH